MKMTMTEAEALGRIKMGVNVDIKRSDGKNLKHNNHLNIFLDLSKKMLFLPFILYVMYSARFNHFYQKIVGVLQNNYVKNLFNEVTDML